MVTATHTQQHATTLDVTLNGEVIHTTDEHPFAVVDGDTVRWVQAQDLQVGDRVLSADGSTGELEAVVVIAKPATMVNLTVETVATYLVGEGQWVVHNSNTVCNLYRLTNDPDQYEVYLETGTVMSEAAINSYNRLAKSMNLEDALDQAGADAMVIHQANIAKHGSFGRYADRVARAMDASSPSEAASRTLTPFWTIDRPANVKQVLPAEILHTVNDRYATTGDRFLFEVHNANLLDPNIYDNRFANPYEGEILMPIMTPITRVVKNPPDWYLRMLK